MSDYRPVEEIKADILKIKAQIANPHSEQRADDIMVKAKSTLELKEILHFLQDELDEAQGIIRNNKWVTGVRRGYD